MRYQDIYDKNNMDYVRGKYKIKYVNQFKGACNIMNKTQSEYIRKGCDQAFCELPVYMYNNAEKLTEEQLSNFVDTFDGESFAIRDIKKVISSLLKNEPALQISTEIEDAKTLSTFYFSNEYRKFYDDKTLNSYLDESGENGYSIEENEYFLSFTKWEDGENTKEVFIWK